MRLLRRWPEICWQVKIMSDNSALALGILQSLEIAALKRHGPRQYELLGDAPAFYHQCFPGSDGSPNNTPWENSPMLEFFLDDAEEFFDGGGAGQYSSGVWQEDGKTGAGSAFIAVAATINNAQLIIVRMLHEDYQQRSGILRKARQQLLDNRNLVNSLETFKTKSRIDGLTQIFNRTTFMEVLQDKLETVRKRMAASKTPGAPLSVLMLDIDNFKQINDNYGHLCGDMVLQTLGKLLREMLRSNDVVARYGGEEFIVLISGGSHEQARKIGEKIRKTIEASDFFCVPAVTVSIGCATFNPGESMESLIKKADEALYEAKSSGKNAVRVR